MNAYEIFTENYSSIIYADSLIGALKQFNSIHKDEKVIGIQLADSDALTPTKPVVDWKQLREDYFEECCEIKPSCYVPPPMDVPTSMKRVALAPHDLFEWFKRRLYSKPVEITEEEIIEAAQQYAALPSVFDPNALRAGFYNGAKWRDRHV